MSSSYQISVHCLEEMPLKVKFLRNESRLLWLVFAKKAVTSWVFVIMGF